MPTPTETIPSLAHAGLVMLEFPATAPTTSVSLPAPVTGNVHSLHVGRVLRPTRGGTLKSVRDNNWPITESFRLQFEGLSTSLKDEFLDFMRLSLGKLVAYTDYETRVWHGIITNVQAAATKTLPVDCGWVVEFDFEGDLQ